MPFRPKSRKLSWPDRAACVYMAAFFLSLLLPVLAYPLFSDVQENESVVVNCDGDLKVWRAPEVSGITWDGLCRTATFNDAVEQGFSQIAFVDGTRVKVRGRLLTRFPQDTANVLALYRAFGTQDALMAKEVLPVAFRELQAAAQDPAWRQPKGNAVKRELKNALEYGLKRLSPTGGIWTSLEAKHALEDAIQRRLDAVAWPPGVSVVIELGYVTER